MSLTPYPFIILPRRARDLQHHQHLLDASQAAEANDARDIAIPLVIDTEFCETPWSAVFTSGTLHGRRGVTIQIKAALENAARIFAHPDQERYAQETNRRLRHAVMRSGFAPIDFLQSLGYAASIRREANAACVDGLPKVQFILYAFFALAELFQIMTGAYADDVHDALRAGGIVLNRRLATVDQRGPIHVDYVLVPWIVCINNCQYACEICIIDASAVHGMASYKSFCANAGIVLPYKDTMKEMGLISRMHEAYFTHPDDFDQYSLGDLYVYDALVANGKHFGHIWDSLGILPYYTGEPKLTIGATVQQMFLAKVLQLFDVPPGNAKARDTLIHDMCSYATAKYLRASTRSTACLLAKVEGGRCRNNRPTDTYLEGVLIDLDLSGCYGEGQRNQLYPFGRPVSLDFPYESTRNAYPTLQMFLRSVGWNTPACELVPGLWHARVSLQPGYRLTNPQDFLASWFNFSIKDVHEIPFDARIEDLEEPSLELDTNTGTLKILTHDIQNAVITHDFVQWLYHVASPALRQELLDHLDVHAALYYPASERETSIEDVRRRQTSDRGRNTYSVQIIPKATGVLRGEYESFAWYAVNLGDFLIEDLLAYRKMHPDKKSPLNVLYKLCVNTMFGDMVSPYFSTSNTVVGNNITARARAACWYMEKGLHGVQSITDGVVFDVNKVVYPIGHRRVTSAGLTDLYRANKVGERHLRFAPLAGFDRIDLSYEETKDADGQASTIAVLSCHQGTTTTVLRGHEALAWVNTAAMEHLRHVFPHVDVLHMPTTRLVVRDPGTGIPDKSYVPRIGQFEFEAKDIYTYGIFHGTANYLLGTPTTTKVKMRSYENTRHETVVLEHDVLQEGRRYADRAPADVFLHSLQTPHAVPRADVFVKHSILRPSQYRAWYRSTYADSPLRPGDSIYKPGLLREFSLSQFTARTVEQFKSLEKEYNRTKNKYDQSIEAYFLNPDGTLDYQQMIETVDKLIAQGSMSLKECLDRHDNLYRTTTRAHPASDTLKRTRALIQKAQRFVE